jgi:phosphoribosylformylglycinamidine synthase
MKSGIVVFPGSNRECDMMRALELTTGEKPVVIWHTATSLPKLDLIVLPGGFSYGDYLRAGAMAVHSPVMREVKAKADAGVYVLAVCNGFQIATEAGLLPGALLRNQGLNFVCRDVHLRVETDRSPFTASYHIGQVLKVPVAHQDGNFFADAETLEALETEDRIAFRYCLADGSSGTQANPNGSARDIAGIFNARKNVLGLMPHPEDAVEPVTGSNDGRGLFQSLLDALA